MGTLASRALEPISEVKAAHTWRAFNGLLTGLSRRFEIIAANTLRVEAGAAVAGYLKGGLPSALGGVSTERWMRYLRAVWFTSVPQGGQLAEAFLPKLVSDVYIVAAAAWLRGEGQTAAAEIAGTSLVAITHQVQAGIAEGLGEAAIAERLAKYYRQIIPGRSENIGFTETHAAINYGSLTAARNQRNEHIEKTWLCTPDLRVRPWHADARGQRVSVDQPFHVRGEKLLYPGDRSLGATGANLNRCRCTQGYSRYVLSR